MFRLADASSDSPAHELAFSKYLNAVRLLTDDAGLQALGLVCLCAACFGLKRCELVLAPSLRSKAQTPDQHAGTLANCWLDMDASSTISTDVICPTKVCVCAYTCSRSSAHQAGMGSCRWCPWLMTSQGAGSPMVCSHSLKMVMALAQLPQPCRCMWLIWLSTSATPALSRRKASFHSVERSVTLAALSTSGSSWQGFCCTCCLSTNWKLKRKGVLGLDQGDLPVHTAAWRGAESTPAACSSLRTQHASSDTS